MRPVKKRLFESHRSPEQFIKRLKTMLVLPTLLTLALLFVFAVLYLLSAHLPV